MSHFITMARVTAGWILILVLSTGCVIRIGDREIQWDGEHDPRAARVGDEEVLAGLTPVGAVEGGELVGGSDSRREGKVGSLPPGS